MSQRIFKVHLSRFNLSDELKDSYISIYSHIHKYASTRCILLFKLIEVKGMNGQSDPARTAGAFRSVDSLPALSVCAKSPCRTTACRESALLVERLILKPSISRTRTEGPGGSHGYTAIHSTWITHPGFWLGIYGLPPSAPSGRF